MVDPDGGNAALGLALGEPNPPTLNASGIESPPPDAHAPHSPTRQLRASASLPPPIITNTHHSHGHHHGEESGHPRSSIPPPPSPRRHRSTHTSSRLRTNSSGPSSGMSPSKSWGDLSHAGLGMTPASERRVSADESTTERLREDGEDNGSWDNSARFYHRLHASSRTTSPTRSNVSASPSVRSPSPGSANSPIFARRNLTLATSNPTAPSLASTLSPNAAFLQQHLPPTFPFSGSLHGSPVEDIEDPLSPPHPPHHMVILTPTTQEWRELKEIRRMEGEDISEEEDVPGSDSSDSTRSRPTSTEIVLQRPEEETPEMSPEDDPLTPGRPAFNPVIIAPSPGPPEDSQPLERSQSLIESARDREDVVLALPEADRSSLHRFNSFGRRDSLKLNTRPSGASGPREKTKRELERERLFKLMDEEIAEAPPTESGSSSWGVQEIGSGGGLDSRGQAYFRPEEVAPRDPVSVPDQPKTVLPVRSIPGAPNRPSPLHTGTTVSSVPPTPASRSPSRDIDLESDKDREDARPETQSERYEAIRNYARSMSTRKTFGMSRPGSRVQSRRGSHDEAHEAESPRSPRRRDTSRVSLVAGRLLQPFAFPQITAMTPATTASPAAMTPSMSSTSTDNFVPKSSPALSALQSFSPFRSPSTPFAGASTPVNRFDQTFGNVSHAPSTGVPSECGTPPAEAAGGVGGRGIDDYVIIKEAGQGAYGLVMRAKVKGKNGQPVGDELIIKYVIKSRILADCWKKHKQLGPIPVEIHVLDQLRHLIYHQPPKPHPWDPTRPRQGERVETPLSDGDSLSGAPPTPADSRANTPTPSEGSVGTTQRYIASELKHGPERGHPNICKLLDFFEDREFYYLVMPRYGTGEDLFDRVESEPSGLDPFEVRSLVGQLTDATRFLHANGIVHRDIKDENVILDGDGRCQLIDFGSAAHWRPGKRWDTFSGTLHYASPEILRGEMYGGKEQDVWALGTVAYVLLVGETPFAELPDDVFAGMFPGSQAVEGLQARCCGIHADEGREADGGGALCDAADFVSRCLEMEIGDRPTAEQLLRHRYLAGGKGWVGHRGWLTK